MPGSGFLKLAEEWHKVMWNAANNPFKNNLVNQEQLGKYFIPSFIAATQKIDIWFNRRRKALIPNLCGTRLEESGGKMSKEEMALLWTASNSVDGGLDTVSYLQSSSSIHKGTNDLNKGHIFGHVILDGNDLEFRKGHNRAWRSRRAEVSRWAPTHPILLSDPHTLRQDDVYEGYNLPKGTNVLPNV